MSAAPPREPEPVAPPPVLSSWRNLYLLVLGELALLVVAFRLLQWWAA